MRLLVNGLSVPISPEFSIAFEQDGDATNIPVLYRKGKRVVKTWMLKADIWMPEQRTMT